MLGCGPWGPPGVGLEKVLVFVLDPEWSWAGRLSRLREGGFVRVFFGLQAGFRRFAFAFGFCP